MEAFGYGFALLPTDIIAICVSALIKQLKFVDPQFKSPRSISVLFYSACLKHFVIENMIYCKSCGCIVVHLGEYSDLASGAKDARRVRILTCFVNVFFIQFHFGRL